MCIRDRNCTRVQAASDKAVIVGKVGGIKSAAQDAVDEVLPSDWKTESVQLGVLDKVVHLGSSDRSNVVGTADGAGTVSATSKVETSC